MELELDIEPPLTNVAQGKIATQSSRSNWSSGITIEDDASVAVNGDTASESFFHTNYESSPWWQVDLQEEFVVCRIKIFNRTSACERLTHFTILGSLTAEPGTWFCIYRKETDHVFGRENDGPFETPAIFQFLARHIRVRSDRPGFLHFRECEVMGFRPSPEQHKIFRNMTVEQLDYDHEARREREIFSGRHGFISKIGDHSIFVDTDNYSEVLVEYLSKGNYEATERRLVKEVIRPDDRIIEVGTAVGVVTMTLASIVGPSNVATYDGNPAIVADARKNFRFNGFDEISSMVGIMRNQSSWSESELEIDFHVARDFWSSRIASSPNDPSVVKVVKVPVFCLEEHIRRHRSNVLVCDIEGGEAGLLTGADLSDIRLIVVETHYQYAGRKSIDTMIKFLQSVGFSINLDFTSGHVVVLDRYS